VNGSGWIVANYSRDTSSIPPSLTTVSAGAKDDFSNDSIGPFRLRHTFCGLDEMEGRIAIDLGWRRYLDPNHPQIEPARTRALGWTTPSLLGDPARLKSDEAASV
jgi:hypothetical protein